MNENDLISLWKKQNAQLDHSLQVNKKVLNEWQSYRVGSVLRSIRGLNAGSVLVMILYLVLLGSILAHTVLHYSTASVYFMVSIGAIMLINIIGLSNYIRQLVLTNTIDLDGPVTAVQQKLIQLQLGIIRHSRVMWLQLPFWTTFYLSNRWFHSVESWGFICLQTIVTGAFTYLAYWLYKNQTIENTDKKWLQLLLSGSGASSVSKALGFYRELAVYKQEDS